ncbi:MAG: transposase [Proteobacteria bacterium]|nr:transposase [Pseudomonadota bacterium]
MKSVDLCRQHGINDVIFYTWRNKYGVMAVSAAKRNAILWNVLALVACRKILLQKFK